MALLVPEGGLSPSWPSGSLYTAGQTVQRMVCCCLWSGGHDRWTVSLEAMALVVLLDSEPPLISFLTPWHNSASAFVHIIVWQYIDPFFYNETVVISIWHFLTLLLVLPQLLHNRVVKFWNHVLLDGQNIIKSQFVRKKVYFFTLTEIIYCIPTS